MFEPFLYIEHLNKNRGFNYKEKERHGHIFPEDRDSHIKMEELNYNFKQKKKTLFVKRVTIIKKNVRRDHKIQVK